jgi:hypothetical protein
MTNQDFFAKPSAPLMHRLRESRYHPRPRTTPSSAGRFSPYAAEHMPRPKRHYAATCWP